jgi:hypothetical protein
MMMSSASAPNLKILCERVNILNRLMRLKDMLLKEDELSAELTISRVTSKPSHIRPFSIF